MEAFLWLDGGQSSWGKHQVIKEAVDKATKANVQGALETKFMSKFQQLNLRSATQFCKRLDV